MEFAANQPSQNKNRRIRRWTDEITKTRGVRAGHVTGTAERTVLNVWFIPRLPGVVIAAANTAGIRVNRGGVSSSYTRPISAVELRRFFFFLPTITLSAEIGKQ